jgi:hypothetical protein
MSRVPSRQSHLLPAACVVCALGIILPVWFTWPTANATDVKQVSPVKVSATSIKPDAEGQQAITIQLHIKEGHRILANPVGCAAMVSAQTKVTITSANKLKDVKIEYPPGKRMILFGEEAFYVYEGKIEIKAIVKRVAGDAGPLEVTVRFFPRNDVKVYFPEQIKLQIK